MAKAKPAPAPDPTPAPTPAAEYTVVARRYRPQQFADLIGQEHVANALVNALQSGRVAHAYLFTGARGVGKTSAARILAKALNCENGPTATPCDRCDSCLAVTAGEDVDVLEIDGASNNKVEEVRDLRHNVGFRPTRGRYKVYIIDEVHMLSTSAFNALLKTLEEPPPHVKFIFATTEVQKIPITILSRCQRFDFAHIGPAAIFDQLKRIVEREGHPADDDALKLIARRAAGSMRDSQSLLDQLLGSSAGRLTAEQVNAVLGTAGDERVAELAAAVLAHDAPGALNRIAGWVDRGLQIGELVDQLIEYWRSLMLVSCGGPDVRELPVSPNQAEAVKTQAAALSLDTILAGLEVWTATKARMRGSSHTQVLLEMAIVRLCRLDELVPVAQLVQTLSQPGTAGAVVVKPGARVGPPEAAEASKKNGQPGSNGSHGHGPSGGGLSTVQVTEATLSDVWGRLIRQVEDRSPILATHLKSASLPAIFGPNSLSIRFEPRYTAAYDACATESNIQRLQEALKQVIGQPGQIRVDLAAGGGAGVPTGAAATDPGNGVLERKKRLLALPLFKRAADTLGAQIWHADEEFDPTAPAAAPPAKPDPTTDPDEG